MLKRVVTRHWPLFLLVFVNLAVGWLILPAFGESVDEYSQNLYADRTIRTLQAVAANGFAPENFVEETPEQGSHGPAFIVLVTLLRRWFMPGASEPDSLYFSHFLYFLVFQVGIVSIFFLARRWLNQTAAFATALLFNIQPIFFGHAFMNPKDVVFMSLFIASLVLGLRMVDRSPQSVRATGNLFADATRAFFNGFTQGDVWFAGLLLGFASAIRLAGPLVGVIILAYIIITKKWQALPKFLLYGLIAFCFMVVFWPYLWLDPIGRLLGSVLSSAYYPSKHITLFNGVLYDSKDIPFFYLPVLLTLQLTIPTLLLIAAGTIYAFKKMRRDLIVLVLIWFVIPAAAIVLASLNLYNNFRQFFFILPPLFLLAGLGLEWLLTFAKRPLFRSLIFALVFLPALYANITLHPYQYIYYNELIGGVRGAYRRFDLDYWNLAYKEAQLRVNEKAKPNAHIYVNNAKYVAQTFARPDLLYNEFGSKNWMRYQFIIVTTTMNSDQRFNNFPTAFTIDRYGVPLAYVKQPKALGQ